AAGFAQLGKQVLAVAVVGLYAFGVTYGLGKLIDRVVGFRVTAEQETSGIDLALHAESAYEHAVLAHGAPTGLFGREHERPRPEPESDAV
ncbi:ammonia channel protein, partial [Rhodococcus hoagii]|nr:ammonia channel protein [Prescottella equi]